MTTLRDLSRHLGLSVTQVSRALNDHDDVSAATKERVQSAAKALNYRPNMSARQLATGRTHIVGLVWRGLSWQSESWVFAQISSGLSAEFDKLGLHLMLNLAEDEATELATYRRLIGSRLIDGFILINPLENDPRVRLLQKRDVPFVLHGQTLDERTYAYFDIDNEAVGYDLTGHLLARGHRRIGFVNGPANATFSHRRRIGYQRALREAGVSFRPEFHTCGMMTRENGILETVRLGQSGNPIPTALIASNALQAKGIIDGCRLLGLRIPQDVSLVMHDDFWHAFHPDSLPLRVTRTVAPLVDAWQPLSQSLEAVIRGDDPARHQQIARHSLIEGDSVRTL